MILQVIMAGNDSSASTLISSAYVLATDKKMQTRLRSNPGDIPKFIDEVIRFHSPFHGHYRKVSNKNNK